MKRLTDAIRLGSFIAPAAAYAGISESTYYAWKERGELARLTHDENLDGDHTDQEPTGQHPDEPDHPGPCPACGPAWAFVEYVEAVTRAQPEAEVAALSSIREAAARHVKRERRHRDGTVTREYEWDWRAAAWLLERRFPERWRKLTEDEPDEAELRRRLEDKAAALLGLDGDD